MMNKSIASSSSISTLKDSIRSILQKEANATIAAQQKKYFKNVIDFLGLKAPTINSCVKGPIQSVIQEHCKNDYKEIINLSFELLQSNYMEEKTVAIRLLNQQIKQIIKNKSQNDTLEQISNLFDEKHIYDWGTCDVLSSQVICEMIKKDDSLVPTIVTWKSSPYLWKQRSACVSFVKIAKSGNYNETIFDICKTTILNSERFVQLGTGWVLRELSLADLQGVKQFIKDHYAHFSREGLRYAIEKMNSKDKDELLYLDGSVSAKRKRTATTTKGKKKQKKQESSDEEEEEEEEEESSSDEE